MIRVLKRISSFVGSGARAFVALIGIAGITVALANYTMTQGSGTTFGSIVVSTVHYAQQLICDPATPSQCGKVDTNGQQIIDVATTNNNLYAAAIAPIPVKAGTLPSTQTPVSTGTTTPAQSDLNGNQYANVISQYPAGAVPLTASATGTTAATTATLAASASLKTYICSYSVRANATAVTTVQNTVTGVVTATLTHQMWVPANTAGLGIDEQIFTPCVPSSAINTAVAVVSGAPGTGGLVSVTATGYQAP